MEVYVSHVARQHSFAFSEPAPPDWIPARGEEVFVPGSRKLVGVVLWSEYAIAKVRWRARGETHERQFAIEHLRPRIDTVVPPRRPDRKVPTEREAAVLRMLGYSPVGAESLVPSVAATEVGVTLFLGRLAAYFGWVERPPGYLRSWVLTDAGRAALASFVEGGSNE